MRVDIDSLEEAKLIYSGYSGKVLSVQTHIGSAVQGGTVNSDVYISSATFEIKKVKVAQANGRIKEFDTDKIEMQEGDEVEFITASNGKNIYLKNLTTGVSNTADLYYTQSGATSFVAIALFAAIGYGLYSVFSGKSFVIGLFCIVAGLAAIILMTQLRARLLAKLESDFHKKVRATGIAVAAFKPLQQVTH